MKKIVLLLALLFTVNLVHAQPPDVPAVSGSTFGEKVTADKAIDVEKLAVIMKMKQQKVHEVKLRGIVTEVCSKEGCWIKIKSPNGQMMVKMKDHGFLVPVALNGKEIVIAGTAEEKVTTVEQLRHFAEDGGKSKEEIEAIKEPKKEIVIQAKGILVL